MKHIFKRALALTMAASFFAVSAFAAPTFSKAAYNAETGILDVEVAGYEAGKDATILVLKNGVAPADATNNDIIFIDQITLKDTTVADYTAPIKVRANAVGATSVNVYVGGDDITTAVPYVKDGETGVSEIKLQEDPAPAEPTYAVVFNKTATYKTLAEAKAAVKVTKTLSGTTTDLAASEFTVTETATATNVYTFVVKVGETVVETITDVTITPDTPSTGKTGIKGEVQRRARGKKYEIAPNAFVMIAKGVDIVATTVTDAEGKFEVELPAGTYGVILRFGLLSEDGFENYGNTIFTDVVVADGAMVTVKSAEKEYVAIEKRLEGDANDDGVINTADLDSVKAGLAS